MGYASIAELKAQVGKTGTDQDTVLAIVLAGAEDCINKFCKRPDGFLALAAGAETARVFMGSGTPVQRIDECVAVTLVAVKDSATETTYDAWASTDWIAFQGDPKSPEFNRTPYTGLVCDPNGDYSVFTDGRFIGQKGFRPMAEVTRGIPTVQVTARWGYSATVPATVKEAAIAQTTRWWKRGQSAWHDALTTPEMGKLVYADLDKDIKMMLVGARLVRRATG